MLTGCHLATGEMSPLASAERSRLGHQRRRQGALHAYPSSTKSRLCSCGLQPDPYARWPESPHGPRLATFVRCWGHSTTADPVVVAPRKTVVRSWLLTSSRHPLWLGANGIVAPPTDWIPSQPGTDCWALSTGVVSPRPAAVWVRNGHSHLLIVNFVCHIQMLGPRTGRILPSCRRSLGASGRILKGLYHQVPVQRLCVCTQL